VYLIYLDLIAYYPIVCTKIHRRCTPHESIGQNGLRQSLVVPQDLFLMLAMGDYLGGEVSQTACA